MSRARRSPEGRISRPQRARIGGTAARLLAVREALVDLVFSPVCLGCDGPVRRGGEDRLVCRPCQVRLVPLPEPVCNRCGAPALETGRARGERCGECREWPAALRSARSACLLEHPADRLVHQLKYRGWPSLAVPLARRMATVPLPEDVASEADLVVPVPTTPGRLRERGYNQAERLASAFAARTGRSLAPLLERGGSRRSQTILQPAARGANVAGAFRLAVGAAAVLRGRHVLLVDDVLTTGATVVECARTLVDGGARCASVLTFARAWTIRRAS